MKVSEIVKLLDGTVLCEGNNMDCDLASAFASDMMSDVLAFVKNQAVLVTGLCNPQVVRTAEMMDMLCIVLVRGKKPDSTLIDLAKERGITVIATPHRMFATCGILYQAGLKAED